MKELNFLKEFDPCGVHVTNIKLVDVNDRTGQRSAKLYDFVKELLNFSKRFLFIFLPFDDEEEELVETVIHHSKHGASVWGVFLFLQEFLN